MKGGKVQINILEVPKMFQKVLQSIRKPELAILEYLKTIKNLTNTLQNQQQTPNLVAVFLALLDPVLGHFQWSWEPPKNHMDLH